MSRRLKNAVKQRLQHEGGASLILVILFVMVFAVVIAAVLDFASTGFKATEAVTDVRNVQHAFDGAMDGAINAIRGSNNAGAEGSAIGCPPFEYDTPSGTSDPKVTVTCTALAGGSTGLRTEKMPEYAILTLGDAACEGFIQDGSHTMTVNGGIFSNNRIAINQFESGSGCGSLSGTGDMLVKGDALAAGKCTWWTTGSNATPKITAAGGAVSCDLGDSVKEATPDYEPSAASTDAVTAAAAAAYGGAAKDYVDPEVVCNPAGVDVDVKFSPGVYTELPDYHVERAGCTGGVWWFQPGIYYFDFPSDDAEWDVYPHQVVGGTLRNASSVTLPDACDPGTEASPMPGVQFIFGGASHVTTHSPSVGSMDGAIDLCAGDPPTSLTTRQRMAVYALYSGQTGITMRATSPTSDTLENETNPTSTDGFVNPQNAKTTNSIAATRDFTVGDHSDSSVVFNGFEDVPNGSVVTGIHAEVRHSKSGTLGGELLLDRRLTLHFESDDNATGPNAGDGHEFKLDTGDCTTSSGVTSCDVDFLEDPFLWREVNSLSASYDVSVGNPGLKTVTICDEYAGSSGNCIRSHTESATAHAEVDSVVITLQYLPPGFETHDSGSDPFLLTGSNAKTIFNGTFFSPDAALEVNVHNSGSTEFARGVIARTIHGSASASSKQTTAPFRLPGFDDARFVLLEAHEGSETGPVRLRAKVRFDDVDGIPGAVVHIDQWNVVR